MHFLKCASLIELELEDVKTPLWLCALGPGSGRSQFLTPGTYREGGDPGCWGGSSGSMAPKVIDWGLVLKDFEVGSQKME